MAPWRRFPDKNTGRLVSKPISELTNDGGVDRLSATSSEPIKAGFGQFCEICVSDRHNASRTRLVADQAHLADNFAMPKFRHDALGLVVRRTGNNPETPTNDNVEAVTRIAFPK